MTCRKAERWLLTSFDRDLPEASREALARHLGLCPECRKRSEEYGVLRYRLAGIQTPDPFPRFWERLETRIAAGRSDDPGAIWLRLWVRAIPVSLSLIAGFLIATFLLRPAGTELSRPEALLLTDSNPIVETRPILDAERPEDRNMMVLFAADERIIGKR
jgi:anti-sigma factor RsiW